jgi:nitroimidazol reductase NimA-like FMN-containing flavoprotein (pyridoxamine 5'-phosphate oxidase superfamily)
MTLDGVGLRVLTDAECLERLATTRLGRVALSWRAMPLILPVRFRLDDRVVVLHARHGTALDQATDHTVVAFEAEGPMGAVEPSWSVVATGLARHHPPRPAGDHDALRRVEIEIGLLSGREVLDPSVAPINLSALPRW